MHEENKKDILRTNNESWLWGKTTNFEKLQTHEKSSIRDYLKKDGQAKNTEDIRRIKDNYLTKDDYFREQAKVDKKLDSIMDILMALSKGGTA